MTSNYIGTKEVVAWEQDKDGAPGFAVKYADGYVSWSPKAVFDRAYRVTEGRHQELNFGDAIHFLKIGFQVARRSWFGRGWLLRVPPTKIITGEKIDANGQRTDVIGQTTSFLAFAIDGGNRYTTWVPTQEDMQAEDWSLVE